MPTNCGVSGCLRGSLAKVFFSAAFQRPGQRQCPDPSLRHEFYQPPSFSTTILEHRRVLPEKIKRNIAYIFECLILYFRTYIKKEFIKHFNGLVCGSLIQQD